MENSEPDAVPVIELNYQSPASPPVEYTIRLVAKWMCVLGAFIVLQFSLQTFEYYVAGIGLSSRTLGLNLASFGTEILQLCTGLWAIAIALSVLYLCQQIARRMRIALGLIVIADVALGIVRIVVAWVVLRPMPQIQFAQVLVMNVMGTLASCLPALILWSIIRQPTIRDVVDGL